MKKLIYCSQCGKKNQFGKIDGSIRYHCPNCKTIHYQNPKPTATLYGVPILSTLELSKPRDELTFQFVVSSSKNVSDNISQASFGKKLGTRIAAT